MISIGSGLLYSVLCLSHPADAAECENYKLSWEPYASSYLPATDAPLIKEKGEMFNVKVGLWNDMNSKQQELYTSTSVLQRLDQAVSENLDKNSNYQESTLSKFYRPDAEGWEGFCHQWSAGSLDPRMEERMLAKADALVCGDVVFTNAELQELVTGFYKAAPRKVIGRRNDGQSPNQQLLLDYSGLDDLHPHKFGEELISNLKDDKGVVIDASGGTDVWNHPIYDAGKCVSETTPEDNDRRGLLIPTAVLSSKDSRVEKALRKLEETENYMVDKIDLLKEKQFQQAVEVLQMVGRNLGIAENEMSGESYGSLRQKVSEKITRLRSEGTIQFKEGVKAEEVTITAKYKIESGYAEPSRGEGGNNVSKRYTYQQYKSADGEVIASTWTSRDYPDFLWEPKLMSEEELKQGPLGDLLRLVEVCELKAMDNSGDASSTASESTTSNRDDLIQQFLALQRQADQTTSAAESVRLAEERLRVLRAIMASPDN